MLNITSKNKNTKNNIDTVEASRVNNVDVSESIKSFDANTQSDTQPSFNHGIINNNLQEWIQIF